MGDISENFDRSEHACGCGCGFDTVDVELNEVLQNDVRDHFGAVVTISGPNRCFTRNLNTPGAAKDSLHTEGKAADIKVAGISPKEIFSYLDRRFPDKYGIGLYHNRVHVDVRPSKARWKKV